MAKVNPKKKRKISRERYAKILGKTDLVDVYLESCSVNFKRELFSLKKSMEVVIRQKASYIQREKKAHVTHKFYLTAKGQEKADDNVLKMSVAFCLMYTTEEASFDNEFFEVFKKVVLPVNSWPYFREFVQSMTQRMGIPPLTLPLIKMA